MDDKILKELHDTGVYQKIKEIKKIYDNLEKKQKKFCDTFCVHCQQGCGQCCEHFVPDITETEALFLAYGLFKEEKDDLVLELLKEREKENQYCPLYLKDSPYHCSVYKWRPMICRLFGASASKDKNGQPTYRHCKYNLDQQSVDSQTFNQHKNAILLMSDYGTLIEELDPNYQTELLPKQLPKAIEKIKYILELEKQQEIK